jgi:hypothetical protein
MPKRTTSEEQFEAFCQQRGIPLERIPEADTRTPDYQVTIGAERIIVEIKETSPNPEELESNRLLKERGYGNVTGGTPGDRVRKMIRSASAQLKARSNGVLPALLVVFDQGRVAGHVEGFHVRVAMYGLEQIYLAVPPPGQGQPYATGSGHGPKRKMTNTDNTSISAIAALVMTGPNSHILYVYRNRFAKVPLNPRLLQAYGVKHYDLGVGDQGLASDWVEIQSEGEP